MASSRCNRSLPMYEIVDILQDDDDSDIEEVQNDEIGEVLSDLQMAVVDQENDLQEQIPFTEPVKKRRRSRERVQRGSRRGRQRGSSACSTSHEHSSGEMDEASRRTYVPRERPFQDPVFEEECRVLVPIGENPSVMDCFTVFFNNDFLELLKTETNRYAAQMKTKFARQGLLKPGSMLDKWTPVTLEEMNRFFSIIIHMSVVHKESFDSYWSTREIIHTPYAAKLMTRDRFRAIYNCLHLNDNTKYIPRGEENYDSLFKLRPYFDALCRLCGTSFYPGENLTIDEGTCCFRDRINYRVFNKDQPEKCGIKIYMLCDAATGYILNMVPNVGASKTVEQIVSELSEPYFGKWHTIYMDRLLTSPTVADLLWRNNTCLVGTVMPSRHGLPQDVNKIGLDLNDQHVSHYSLHKKSMKWWKKMFFYLVSRAMVNCMVMYNKHQPPRQQMPFSQFLIACGEGIVEARLADEPGPSHGAHISGSTSRLVGRHFIERIPSTEKKTTVTRVCKVCADSIKHQTGKRGRKETVFYCPDCNVPLCNDPCFKKYHTVKNYHL